MAVLLTPVVPVPTAGVDGPGTRVRPAVTARPLVALAVRHLTLVGDKERGSADVSGLDLDIEAGALVLVLPSRPARALLDCLSGRGPARSGEVLARVGAGLHPVLETGWTAVVVPRGPRTGPVRLPDDASPAVRRAAERMGLGAVLADDPVEASPHQLVLLALAEALGEDTGVVALDDPGAHLTEEGLTDLLTAVRELVDVEGRTVLVTADDERVPDAARALFDRVLHLDAPPPASR